MKTIIKIIGIFVLFLALQHTTQAQSAQEVKVITIVESIVPMGIGRSRIIEHQSEANASDFTTERNDGKDSKQGT